MTDSADPFAAALTSEKLRAVHAVWRDLKGQAIGPKRAEITPARLRGVMPWTFVMEVAEGDFRFSFAGDRIVQFMGKAHAGLMLSSLLGTPFYDGMNRFLANAIAARAPRHVGPLRSNFPDKEHLEMEVIVLPLSEDGEHVSALVGAFETWQAGRHSSG